jgi:hypothetical protein
VCFEFTKIRKSTELVGLRDNKIVGCVIDPAVKPLVKMRVEMTPGHKSSIGCQMSLLSDGDSHYEVRKGIRAVELDGPNLAKVQKSIGKCVEEYRKNSVETV